MDTHSYLITGPHGLSVKESRILTFLELRRSGVLATAGADNRPHASVIYYAIDEYFAITFLTKNRTKKSQNLKHNPSAVLAVYDEQTQTTVEVAGEVEKITDKDEMHQAFRHTLRSSLRTSGMGVPPVAKLYAGDYVAFRLNPRQITMASYTNPATGKKIYESLDFSKLSS